jgi:uncharacterized protein (TIGR03437 family)
MKFLLLIIFCFSSALSASQRNLPLAFEPNRGQAPKSVDFQAHLPGGTLLLNAGRAELVGRGSRIAIRLDHSNAAAEAQGEALLPGTINYIGRATGVPTFERVRYRGVYPGIDLVYYTRDGHLEYDFEVAPGADPMRIRLRMEGAARPELDTAGNLVLPGGFTLHSPLIYQETAGGRRIISGGYRLRGNEVRIALGRYDRTRPLVIDPVITWATYLGYANTEDEAVAVDSAGNIYTAGYAVSPYGDADVFVVKFSPDGARQILAIALPGSSDDDAHAIAVDSAGNIYLAGDTNSSDFLYDHVSASSGARAGFQHAFITKINASGQAILYSHLVAGATGETATAIAVDSSGSAYAAGTTSSPDFPTTSGVAQTTGLGKNEAFAIRLDATGARLWSTLLSGAGDEYATSIAIDSTGNAYVAGTTSSTNLPVTAGVWQSANAGGFDAYAAKLSPTGGLIYCSYLGGAGDDLANGIAVDASGAAYLTGETGSKDFPSVNAWQSASAGAGDIFVAKLAADAASLGYSTYLGGAGEDGANGIAIDPAGNVYLTGSTASADFPSRDAFQAARGTGPTDAVVAALDASGSLIFSSFLGGNGTAGASLKLGDIGWSLAMSCSSGLVVAGRTVSTDFPVTSGVLATTFPGGVETGFIARLGVGGTPVIAAGGVVNSASYSAGNVAPGSLVTLFGTNLAWGAQPPAVTVNGAPVPVLGASAGQINIQLPYDVAPGSASVTVAGPCGPSAAAVFQVSMAAPYIRVTATGDAVADPAKAAGTLTLSLVGIGPVDNPVAAGTATPSDPLSKATLSASATIGGFDAPIQFLGLTPSAVGLAQAILSVPPQLAPGSYPAAITVGGVTSNSATVYIQQ